MIGILGVKISFCNWRWEGDDIDSIGIIDSTDTINTIDAIDAIENTAVATASILAMI